MLLNEEKPSQVCSEHALHVSLPEVSPDSHDAAAVTDSSLLMSPDPTNHSLTFVTPSSSILNTPRTSPSKTQPSAALFSPNKIEQTPLGAEGAVDELAAEEKPPCEEKHVTSTPYLGVGSLKSSIGKPFETCSRLDALHSLSTGEISMGETGEVFIGVLRFVKSLINRVDKRCLEKKR